MHVYVFSCVPIRVLMHYSMPFCTLNSVSGVSTLKIEKVHFQYPDDALI